jgi:hypothetical protein
MSTISKVLLMSNLRLSSYALSLIGLLSVCACSQDKNIVGRYKCISGNPPLREIVFLADSTFKYVSESGRIDEGVYFIKRDEVRVVSYTGGDTVIHQMLIGSSSNNLRLLNCTLGDRLREFEKEVITLSFRNGKKKDYRMYLHGDELRLAYTREFGIDLDTKEHYQFVDEPQIFNKVKLK